MEMNEQLIDNIFKGSLALGLIVLVVLAGAIAAGLSNTQGSAQFVKAGALAGADSPQVATNTQPSQVAQPQTGEAGQAQVQRPSAAGSCGAGGGCGCGGGGAPRTRVNTQLTGNRITDAQNAALAYYAQKYGDGDVTAKATDYGCHVQVDIYKNGQVIKTLGYSGGSVFEA
ncbi:MAG: hypothetical protein AB1468_03880 [Candidatus Micrarchaeota archaeon]